MKARLCTFGLFLLGLTSTAICIAAAQSAPDTAPLVLPMENVGGHLYVELEDRTLGKLRMMVDTGAEKTLLSARAAEKAKVDRHFTDRFFSFNGFGQGEKAKLAGHTTLELRSGERSLAKVEALVLDSGNLDGKKQPALDGILGWDFFQHLCVRLNSKEKRMTLGTADHCATNEEGFYTPPVEWLPEGLLLPVTITLANQHTIKLKLHVDTGSDSIVLSPRLRGVLELEGDEAAARGAKDAARAGAGGARLGQGAQQRRGNRGRRWTSCDQRPDSTAAPAFWILTPHQAVQRKR